MKKYEKKLGLQQIFNARKGIIFESLIESVPEQLEDVKYIINKWVLAPEVKKLDKIAFFEATKSFFGHYVNLGKSSEAKALLDVIAKNYEKLMGNEFIAFTEAMKSEKKYLIGHPENQTAFKGLMEEYFGKLVNSNPELYQTRWNEVIDLLGADEAKMLGEEFTSQDSI